MSYIQHLSVRVPWHDTGWTGAVCAAPSANSHCLMLDNIGRHRNDDYENNHAGADWASIVGRLPPCAAERGGFMSAKSHVYRRRHPYATFPGLGGLEETDLEIPAYALHSIPFFWLNRRYVDHVLMDRPIDGFHEELEGTARKAVKKQDLNWVLHGDNQQAIIESFYRNVTADRSLVFFYLKHSPFEDQPRRMLVGAATVTHRTQPGRWPGSGKGPFPSHMWETTLRHSLRPGGTGGILLPVQALARLAATGVEVGATLAKAPEVGRNFSYGTEHVAPDAAVASLMELDRAVRAVMALGDPSVTIPEVSRDWLDDQLRLAWQRRGPAPGLPAVLSLLGWEYPTFSAHRVLGAVGENADPWPLLEGLLGSQRTLATGPAVPEAAVADLVTDVRRTIWRNKTDEERQALKLLSRFDLTPDMARRAFQGELGVETTLGDLLDNPYDLVTCSIDDGEPVPFEVVDRGCYADHQVTVHHPLPVTRTFDDPNDPRRIDAAMSTVLLRALNDGHTLLPFEQMVERLDTLNIVRAFSTDWGILSALGLVPPSLQASEEVGDSEGNGEPVDGGDDNESQPWSQVRRTALAEGEQAYKLASAAARRDFIRERLNQICKPGEHAVPADLATTLNTVVGRANRQGGAVDPSIEKAAREEKYAALGVLYAGRMTVLNGPAGTGKTTLITALAHRREVVKDGLLLLAPTGKARVQLQNKVGREAFTLAQFLNMGKTKRYDEYERYVTRDGRDRRAVGTVVVDEASMLTEEMLASLLDAVEVTRRLILVGDRRQLPPIGSGRPFVDIESTLRPEQPSWPRTAKQWAELTVLHRQRGQDRHDLALARWYGDDEIDDAAEHVWENLRAGVAMPTLRAVPWNSRRPAQVLDQVLREEFGVSDALGFAKSYGAGENVKDGRTYPDFSLAPTGCDAWQVLSPVRGRPHGTMDLNRHLKQTHRSGDLKRARRPDRSIPKPLGPEQIVVGDKVVNTTNHQRRAFDHRSGQQRHDAYVANGEIGVVTGRITKRGDAPWSTDVEFSTQPKMSFSYTRRADDEEALELAWALTVHKSQGSEFGTVILMLPADLRRISRELVYTALTRQTDKIVICHEGPLEALRDLAAPTASDTARRLTDLRRPPKPVLVPTPAGPQIYDGNLIHVTHRRVAVRSKNEVIVANLLERLAPGLWAYEQPLVAADGTRRWPDFTIQTDDPNRPIYWEHLGKLQDPAYARKWETKKQWYAAHGVLPAPAGGPRGILLVTDDLNGVHEPDWEAAFRDVFGTRTTIRQRPITRRSGKRR
ncbi:AAA family ATPase (plasmid) [Embleya sp. NBC_00888]|uniref:AAA family ATPase n=1 Tax=Embleya sp. NBC_00888 TaxID=2975960 RepID=UPI002F90C685|nr:AAA family ATPase [Embleya sp. NBC_00888]